MRTGDVIDGRYRLEDNCGSGGCGVVWTAFDRKLKRTVALKRPHVTASQADRLRFRREAETAAQVHHPNAVSIYDTVDGDDCWLVMEYAPAAGLDEVLATTGALPPKRVARIGVQIAAALLAVHAKDIVHRDVKPGNILVDDNDFAKLTDFGISLWREVTYTQDGRFTGTPAYSAPEVANARPATAASDVFSLGATLFAAVEGTPPFGTGELDEVLARARRGELLPMRQAGPLAELLSEMLDVRPEKRPTADQVRRRLMEVAGEWEPPYPVGRAAAVRPSFWRRPRYQAVTAGALVAVAVVGVVLVSEDPPPAPDPVASPPAGNVIGVERTADPCALLDRQVLRGFGPTELDSAHGNFNRCDVLINVGSVENAKVEVQLVNRRQRPVQADPFEFVDEGSDTENCDRTMPVDHEYAVRLTVRMPSPPANLDLCDISDVALETVKTKLRNHPLPRRAPFPPDSLAHVAACPLLDDEALAEVPGIPAGSGVLGFGGWECKWHSAVTGTQVHLRYDQHLADAQVAGEYLPFNGGREARVSLDSEGGISVSCTVRVVYQPANWTRRRNVDLIVLTVDGERPGEEYCAPATRLAEAAAANLPR